MLAGLAWRNLWRQPRRTLLSLASIAFAALVMVFLMSFQLGVYATMKENVLRIVDGFAQVQPAGYRENPSLRKTIDAPGPIIARLRTVPGVGAVAPRTMGFAIVSSGDKSFGTAVFGVDPAMEPRVSRLNHTIVNGRYLKAGDENAVVIGKRLARNLDVKAGDTISVLGEALDGSIAADVLTVVGIFDTGTREIDRQLAEMPLARFQATFAMNDKVNTLAISGNTLADVDSALGAIRRSIANENLKVQNWQALEPGLDGAISLDFNTSMLWYTSLVVIVVFIILNTLLMSVLERTREFGVLLSVGMRPAQVGIMVWLELTFLALVGLAVGIAIGDAVTLVVAHYGLELPGTDAIFSRWGLPGRLFPRLSLVSMLSAPVIMGLSIVVAGIFPYRHVDRLEPISAMRESL
ncbi:MAG TPA: ABC transporter permease [Pseudomonadales bacterium]|nr:ABC transporter permease [Pseudomonadales bacterium]